MTDPGAPSRAERPVIVSTGWLAANLASPDASRDLRVVDIRGKVLPPGSKPRYLAKRPDYDLAHVPGAVFVDWTRDIVDPEDPVPMQVATPEAFASKMVELGIGDETLVVAYDDYDHIFAGRLAWALRYYGHDAVRILDGGWSQWLAEGRPTETAMPTAGAPGPDLTGRDAQSPARTFTPRLRAELRRTAGEVQGALGRPDVVLIDARPPEQYTGAITAATRAGHIPGAVNVPYARLVDATTGRFLPTRQLAGVFRDAGVDVDTLPREVIVYCNGGVSCTVPLNALRMLGRDDVAVFDGSWNEWGDDASRPINVGQQP